MLLEQVSKNIGQSLFDSLDVIVKGHCPIKRGTHDKFKIIPTIKKTAYTLHHFGPQYSSPENIPAAIKPQVHLTR